MGENNIPFQTELTDDGLTVGIDKIISALQALDDMANQVGATLSAAFSLTGNSMTDLLAKTDAVLTGITDGFTRTVTAIRSGTDAIRQGFADMGTSMDDLNNYAASMDQQLFDVVNVLGDIKTNGEQTNTILADMATTLDTVATASTSSADSLTTLVGQMNTLIGAVRGLADAAPAAATGVEDLATAERSAGEGASFFGAGASNMLAMMGGFQIFNLAARAVGSFWNAAINGSAEVERFRVTLASFLGDGNAQKILDWAKGFAVTIPDTWMNLQKSLTNLASLQIRLPNIQVGDIEHLQSDLATIAGIMHVDLPTATQAFMSDFNGRVTMMQQRLHLTNEELTQFGLKMNGKKIDRSTLIPAFENFVEHEFPDGLKKVMETYTGQLTNLQDFMQLLALQFGQPIFDKFKQGLGDLLYFLVINRQAIYDFANAVGSIFAGAINLIFPLIGKFISFLQQNHWALAALIGLLGGTFIGIILSVGAAILAMLGPLFGIASAIGALAGPIVAFIIESQPARDLLQTLWDIAQQLADILGSALSDAFSTAADAVAGLVDALFGTSGSGSAAASATGKAAGGAKDLGGAADQAKSFIQGLNRIISDMLTPLRNFDQWLRNVAEHMKGMGGGVSVGGVKLQMPKLDGADFKKLFSDMGEGLKIALPLLAGLLPILIPVMFGARDAAQWFRGLGNMIQLAGYAGGRIGEAFAGLPGLFSKLGDILHTVVMAPLHALFDAGEAIAAAWGDAGLTGVVDLFFSSLGELGGALWGLVAPFAAVLGIAAAVAAVIAVMVFAFIHWWQTNESFRKGIMAMLGDLAQLGGVLMGSLKQAWQTLQGTLAQLKPVWDNLVVAFHDIEPILLVIAGVIGVVLAAAFGVLVAIIRGLLTALGPVLSGLITMFIGVVQVVGNVIAIIVTIISGFIKFFVDLFVHRDLGAALGDLGQMFQHLLPMIGGVFQGLWNIISGFFGGLLGGVIGFVTGFVQGIISWFQHLFDILVGHSIVPDLINKIIEFFVGLPIKVLATIGEMVVQLLVLFLHLETMALAIILEMRDKFLNFIEELVIGTIDKIGNMIVLALGHISSWASRIEAEVLKMRDNFLKFIDELVLGTIAKFGDLVIKGIAKIKDLISQINTALGGLPGMMAKWASDAVSSFVKSLLAGVGQVANAAGQIAGAIGSVLHHSTPDIGPMAGDDKWMPDFVDNMAQGLDAGRSKLAAAAGRAAGTVRDAINGTLTGSAVPGYIGSGAGAPVAPSAGTTVNVTMPDSFAAGFSMLDNNVKQALVYQLKDEISRQLGQDVRTQSHYATGYSGYTRG